MIDVNKVLLSYGEPFSIAGNPENADEYADAVTWMGASKLPSWADVVAKWPSVNYEAERLIVEEARRLDYVTIVDPLFFGYQAGENTEQDWLDARQAVKDAHPYPTKEAK